MWCMCTRYKDIRKMFVILVMWRQSTIIHSRHTVWSESHCFLRIFPVMETENKSKNWFHISTITEHSFVATVHSKKKPFSLFIYNSKCVYIPTCSYWYEVSANCFFNSFKRFASSGSDRINKSKEVQPFTNWFVF